MALNINTAFDVQADDQRKKQAAALKALQSTTPPTTPVSTASTTMQLRQAIGAAGRAAGAGTATTGQAAQAKQALTEGLGQQALTAEQTQQARQQTLGQMALQSQAMDISKQLADREVLLNRDVQQQQLRLASLSRDLTKQLHDDTIQFQRDDMGRTLWNEKQLLDYAIIQAQNQEDLTNYMQTKELLLDRKQQALKQAYNVISQQLNQLLERDLTKAQQTWTAEEQEKNQQLKEYLSIAQKQLEQKMADTQRKANESAAESALIGAGIGVLAAVNPIAGAAVGGIYAAGKATGILSKRRNTHGK